MKYLHFTDLSGAEGISKTKSLWQSSYGPAGAVFAVAVGSHWVPNVQMSSLGRAKIRSQVIIFETELLPDYAMPEEVMWHVKSLQIKNIKIISPAEAKKILNNSIAEDPETEMLKIKLHPAFNVLGAWDRMPEEFSYWVPSVDNEKYNQAWKIWNDTKSIKAVKTFWNIDKNIKNSNLVNFLIDTEVKKL